MDEYILERWSSKSGGANVPRERLHHIADEFMTTWPFHPQRAIHYCRLTAKALAQLLLQAMGVWGLDDDDVAPNALLEGIRGTKRDQLALVQYAHAVTALGILH